MKAHQAQQEIKKQQIAMKYKNEDLENEMKECTFSPRLETKQTKEGRMYIERVGDRSTKSQSRIVEQHIAKKEQWMAIQLKEKEEKEYQIQARKMISKGSEKILKDKSRASSNKSVNSFLARNYY